MIDKLHRQAIEKTYTDICTVTEYQKYKKSNKTTGFRESAVYTDEPCRLSFKTVNSATGTGTLTKIGQIITLFISPDADIKAGSKITVTHDGRTADYKRSGFPAVYKTHQEIPLELYDENA